MLENEVVQKRMVDRALPKEDIGQLKTPETFRDREKIFIVGPPRSGTTLINSLVSRNLFLPECSFVSNLIKMFDEVYKYSDDKRFNYYVYDLDKLVEIFNNPIHDFLFVSSKTIKSKPDDQLVFKDPMLTNYLQYFDLFFNDSYKTIFCVRDPRDTIASMLTVLRKQQKNINNRLLFRQAEEFIYPFYYKIYAIDHGMETVNVNRILFIRYEDVVQKDNSRISELETFIDRKIDFSTGNVVVSSRLDKTSPFYSKNYGGLVTRKSIGAYKKVLTRAQIKLIEKRYEYYLEKYSY